VIVRGIAIAIAVIAGTYMLGPPAPPPDWAIKFQPFDKTDVIEARQDGRTVVIKFTANWCFSCAIVESAVYKQRDVADKFNELDVYAVKGDVTQEGSPADVFLRGWAGLAVPVSAVYLPGRTEPAFLKGKFDKSELIKLLASAAPAAQVRRPAVSTDQEEVAIEFRPFDQGEMLKARRENRVVVIKFTADWCLRGTAIDAAIYQQRDVAEKFRRLDVYAAEGDVTQEGSPADVFLRRWPGLAVPVTAVYLPSRSEPVFLKGEFDKAELLELLDSASG
ncbi:MAG: hypothetical protein ACYTF6_14975, partial [Planctomycetota bacterium]|jgi:thiol:disulfide interchange protein